MKIIHVVNSMDPAQGGPPMVVSRLAAAQAQLGHQVEIVSLRTSGDSRLLDASLQGIPHFEQVSVTLEKPENLFRRLLGFRVADTMERRIAESAFVHVHGMWRPLLAVAAKMASRQGIKYALAPHGMLAPWCLGQKRWKKQIALAAGWRKILEEASFLHMLNGEEVNQLEPLGKRPRVEIIPNGVFPEEMDRLPDKSTFWRLFPSLKNRPYILFLGRLHRVKGLDYLADAFSAFVRENHSVDLVVVGPDGGAKLAFERHISGLGLSNRVHMVGPLYGASKYAAMVDALCVCQPSRYEGFSMTITEAMGCGLPVVISKYCNFPEVAEVGAGEVVDLDAGTIGSALRRLVNDDNWRQQAGHAAKQLVLSRFTWPKIAEKSIDAYNK